MQVLETLADVKALVQGGYPQVIIIQVLSITVIQ